MANSYENLSKKIKESKVKQRELAKSVGVSAEHLNAMLNGRLVMNDNMYNRINYWYEKIKEEKANA